MRLIDADGRVAKWKEAMLHMVKDDDGKHPISLEILIDDVECAPTIDAVHVVHGRWGKLDECANEGVYCSVCHKKVFKLCYANQKLKSPYCPNCGAKMDGEADG